MRRSGGPSPLLVPRARPGRVADFATRASLIAHQGHPARIRRVRRSLRIVGRVLAWTLGLAAAAVVLVVTAHWMRTNPLLAVTAVEVEGVRRLSEETVRVAAGIEPGANLLALDVPAIEERLAALPGVRSARVVRHLPHRVTVTVEERRPYALVNAAGRDRLVWIDAEGYLVGTESRPGAPPLPILSGVEAAGAGAARTPGEGLRTGVALLRAIQRSGGRVAGRISEIDVAAADGPVLYLVDGVEVRVGGESWDERLARLDGVLGDLEARGERVTSVDLRFRDLVVLTPRPATPADLDARARVGGRGRRGATANSRERR